MAPTGNRDTTQGLPGPVLMLLAMAVLPMGDSLSKLLVVEYPAAQIT